MPDDPIGDNPGQSPLPEIGDECLRHIPAPETPTEPARPAIHVTSVYACRDIDQADAVLGGSQAGFAYQREGHPNEHVLAERCRRLHQAEFAAVAPSGMGAIALAVLSTLQAGDHALISDQLYGKTQQLFDRDLSRWGIEVDHFDARNLDRLSQRMRPNTRLVVVETISNPLMHVADLPHMAEMVHAGGARLLVDNTFASPAVCQPLRWGADLVMESLTKIMNGHSDVILGLLCGREPDLQSRVNQVQRTWGLVGSPFDCWLADRGLNTLHLRIHTACANAAALAQLLVRSSAVQTVHYPGLADPDRSLAESQFNSAVGEWAAGDGVAGDGAAGDGLGSNADVVAGPPGFAESADPLQMFGHMLSFRLGNREQVDRFVGQSELMFCPSLGDFATTISHPATTSHRGLDPATRDRMGIDQGLVRISVGTEPLPSLARAIQRGLIGLDDSSPAAII